MKRGKSVDFPAIGSGTFNRDRRLCRQSLKDTPPSSKYVVSAAPCFKLGRKIPSTFVISKARAIGRYVALP